MESGWRKSFPRASRLLLGYNLASFSLGILGKSSRLEIPPGRKQKRSFTTLLKSNRILFQVTLKKNSIVDSVYDAPISEESKDRRHRERERAMAGLGSTCAGEAGIFSAEERLGDEAAPV